MHTRLKKSRFDKSYAYMEMELHSSLKIVTSILKSMDRITISKSVCTLRFYSGVTYQIFIYHKC